MYYPALNQVCSFHYRKLSSYRLLWYACAYVCVCVCACVCVCVCVSLFFQNGLLGNAPSSMTGGSMMPKASSLPSASQFPTSAQRSMGSIDNSLKDFDYRIVCPQCFIFENFPGKYRYMPCTHECEENVLAVKQRGVPSARWMRVRERTNHRDFSGNYVMCHSIIESDPSLCRFGEFQCSFAHNEAEQQIWGLEKSGRFSITDFILQNRHSVTSRGYTVDEVLKKYGGFFTYVCRNCFYGRPPRISVAAPNNCCSGMLLVFLTV